MGGVRGTDPSAHDPVALSRSTRPVLQYLDEIDADSPDDVITVIIPEFVTQWKTQWLHNQSAFALKARLLYRPNTVVTSVPVLIGTEHDE